MPFITPAQLLQLGRKCSHCEKKAQWLDKFDEGAPAYCDEHFPYSYESEELEEIQKGLGEALIEIIKRNYSARKE